MRKDTHSHECACTLCAAGQVLHNRNECTVGNSVCTGQRVQRCRLDETDKKHGYKTLFRGPNWAQTRQKEARKVCDPHASSRRSMCDLSGGERAEGSEH